jgi:hypothetical protein
VGNNSLEIRSEIGFDGTEGEFATEVLAEGFRRDADDLGDTILRDALGGEETV